jgi:hypothetical protein
VRARAGGDGRRRQELGGVVLALHFGDRSHAALRCEHSRLIAAAEQPELPSVAVHFDNRALKLLFDAGRRPVDALFAGSLDVRGTREQVLATWRCFELLAQRASGLRAVQALWLRYRDLDPERWSAPVNGQRPARAAAWLFAISATGRRSTTWTGATRRTWSWAGPTIRPSSAVRAACGTVATARPGARSRGCSTTTCRRPCSA